MAIARQLFIVQTLPVTRFLYLPVAKLPLLWQYDGYDHT